MSSFEETLARMKGLYTYGKELNEGNDLKTHTLEYHAIAADGKSYGIIKECNKYYIKSAPKDKEMIAESYEYLGGFCNKKNYEYSSYANALKNFELKMASINEACEGNVNISTLDPFKKEEFLVEGTDRMKNEIARQRQIMYNASMIMNEANEIGASNKDNVVKYNGTNPETPKKNGNSINDGTDAKVVDQDKVKGFSGNNPHEDKTSGPYTENPSNVNEGACCGKCGKNPCECQNCNEEAGDISDEPLMPNTRNWAGPKMGASEPDQIGWDMDGQEKVNEETKEWDEGLPGSAGIGEPDTDHNNDPFNKSINEGEEDFDSEDSENPEADDDSFDLGGDEFSDETEEPSDETDEFGDETEEFGDETDEFGNDEFDDENEFDDEESTDEPSEDEDLRSEIESLKAEIEALKSQINGEDTDVLDGAEDSVEDGEDFGPDSEFGSEDGEDFSTEGDIEECGDMELNEIGDTPRGQHMLGRLAARQQYRSGQETGRNNGLGYLGDGGSDETMKYAHSKSINKGAVGDAWHSGWDSQWKKMGVNEAKKAKMDSIVESVVKSILKEDELHVFGKHPGYRKKPMELPTTGEDQNQWGRDWNDESVHSEEPFGKQIGDGDPFTQLVNAVTKDVMYQLKKSIPIEGANKKKVD